MNQKLREALRSFLDVQIHRGVVDYETLDVHKEVTYERHLISYQGSEGDEINAYLFIPTERKIIGSVLVHHQHHGERHLGKSEVAGIAGDPFQSFCPALAKIGIMSLAPDSICFEDRRRNKRGIEPDEEDPDNDWLQHYNEMAYRLLEGKLLMEKVIADSSIGISLLLQHKESQADKIGLLGHSYGGNTVLFHSPLDERITHSCSSGAVCSYKTKMKFEIGIELAEVIPGFMQKYDILDLLKCICPRKLLIVSGSEDKYSLDAPELYEAVKNDYDRMGKPDAIQLHHYPGGHALNKEKFAAIIDWFEQAFK